MYFIYRLALNDNLADIVPKQDARGRVARRSSELGHFGDRPAIDATDTSVTQRTDLMSKGCGFGNLAFSLGSSDLFKFVQRITAI